MRIRVTGYIKPVGERRGVYKLLVWKPDGKKQLGRSSHRIEDNIKMNLQEVGFVDVDLIELAKDRDILRKLLNVIMKILVP